MRFSRALLLSLCVALTTLSPQSARSQSDAPASEQSSDDLDLLIRALRDDGRRAQLLERLEASGVNDTKTRPADEHGSADSEGASNDENSNEVIGGGLLTGVQQWATELGERLPTAALGAPIEVKVEEAKTQIGYRLQAPDAVAELQDFSKRALLGWALVSLASLLALAAIRARICRALKGLPASKGLTGEAAARSGLALLPMLTSMLAGAAWARAAEFSDFERTMFLLLIVPLAGSLAFGALFASLLVLLVRSKGYRLIAYAQRRLSPLVAILTGIALAASVAATPQVRIAIGPAMGDIISLVLDLAVPLFALVVIIYQRRTVRTLIVRGYSSRDDAPLMDRAIRWMGNHWHHFGLLFAVLNVGARLFGSQSGNFLTQSSYSLLLIVVAFITVTSLRRLESRNVSRRTRRRPSGMRAAILSRFSRVGYRAAQVLACITATVFLVRLWGIDAVAWFVYGAGASVVGPIFSIVTVMLVAWMLWVILDAWIAAALEPSPGRNHRERSARVKTLLPLLRNIAFVVLSVLTVIGVLSNLGINVAPLIAGAGVVGLAVGFGSQQLVADVITGLFILLEDTLAIGDVVNTGDRSGTVEALTIRTMKIRDGDGSLHSIPFSTVKALKNSSRGFGVYTVAVTLDLDADVDAAIQTFKDVGDEVCREPKFSAKIIAPLDVWGVDQVGPDGIVIKGSIKTLPLQQHGVGREINRRLNLRLQDRDIRLASRKPTIDPPGALAPA